MLRRFICHHFLGDEFGPPLQLGGVQDASVGLAYLRLLGRDCIVQNGSCRMPHLNFSLLCLGLRVNRLELSQFWILKAEIPVARPLAVRGRLDLRLTLVEGSRLSLVLVERLIDGLISCQLLLIDFIVLLERLIQIVCSFQLPLFDLVFEWFHADGPLDVDVWQHEVRLGYPCYRCESAVSTLQLCRVLRVPSFSSQAVVLIP